MTRTRIQNEQNFEQHKPRSISDLSFDKLYAIGMVKINPKTGTGDFPETVVVEDFRYTIDEAVHAESGFSWSSGSRLWFHTSRLCICSHISNGLHIDRILRTAIQLNPGKCLGKASSQQIHEHFRCVFCGRSSSLLSHKDLSNPISLNE